MAIIDNKEQTMYQALANALTTSDRIDILVGYFYFSGFELLSEELKNKKIRILVGKQIDPNAVSKIVHLQQKHNKPVDFDKFQPQEDFSSRSEQKSSYYEGFIKLFNETKGFDNTETQKAYKIFEEKILNGSLEIKLTSYDEHGKTYLVHNSEQFNQGGDYPGTKFIGSSNFTYNGLIQQGELNDVSRDKQDFLELCTKFDLMWNDSKNIDIVTKDNNEDFKKATEKLWINDTASPYLMYVRVLHELFNKDTKTDIETPSSITSDSFSDLEYQLDAIKMGLDRLEQYGGVIIADVVGLGKSIIASAIAYNVAQKDKINVVIITPPHLKDQWDEYQSSFRLPGTKIFTSGKIEEAYNWCLTQIQGPVLLILDEAHRYRNELTDDYNLLHSLSRCNTNNKVVILTATPFNNDPKDVFALVKLFQTPGQSTIRSVDNLSIRFRELIERYKKLRSNLRGEKITPKEVDKESKEIASELRRLIEPVIVRRSRIDLQKISRYRNNLIKQGISFAEVEGPDLLEYELGDLFYIYLTTLEAITNEEKGFKGARYKPVTYIKDDKRDLFKEKYSDYLNDEDLQIAQTNLAYFMKRLLVMRFESSKEAFKITLQNMIDSNKSILKWYQEKGKVPILKKGKIPDPNTFIESTEDNVSQEIDQEIEIKDESENKYKLLFLEKDWLKEEFINDVIEDTKLLIIIQKNWFGEESTVLYFDPKLDSLIEKIELLRNQNPFRKIVIFSAYADTVDYLGFELKKRNVGNVFKYTAKDASQQNREILRTNFDAGIRKELQKDDYDILVATDALSEGYNLHRAGVIFNYDIPFNPTRVIQRIGRINRINKKVYDVIHVYNFFPTDIGEAETKIQQISTLKMTLINAVVGSDTKTLTNDEELKSFFKEEYSKANVDAEYESWDAEHREAYDQIPQDTINQAVKISPRSRTRRENCKFKGGIAFGKKGNHAIFAIKTEENQNPEIVSAEEILSVFSAKPEEKFYETNLEFNDLFQLIVDKLFEKHKLPKIQGNRAKSLQILQILEDLPSAKDYCIDLSRIIKDYDDLTEGQYKEISRLDLEILQEAYEKIQLIVPKQTIETILKKVSQQDNLSEVLLLSEELS